MANKFKSKLQAADANSIANSLRDALIFLNSQNIEEGKLYSKRYFANSEKTKVDVILVVGVLAGTGPDCYSIISKGDKIVVWDIVSNLPDVSQVAQGQLYIYWDSSKEASYLVYLKSENRIIEPVVYPMLVHNTADNHLYYVSKETIVDVYDHLENAPYFEERLELLERKVQAIIEGGDIPVGPIPPGPGEDDPEEETTTTTTTTSTTPTPPPPPPADITTTTTTTPKPTVALSITSFNMDVAEQHETGEVVNPKFTWSYNQEVKSQSLYGESLGVSVREKQINGITTDTAITLTASNGSTNASKTKNLYFSPVTYMGSGRSKIADINESNFFDVFTASGMEEGFSNEVCKGTVTKTFTSETKGYVLLAFPSDKVKNLVIYDLNDFEVTWYTNELTIVNSKGATVKYTVYQSPSASKEFTFKFKF